MQLYYFLAVIISLSFGSVPPSGQSQWHAWTFSAAVIAGWWILCMLACRIVARSIQNGDLSADVGFRLYDRQLSCFRWFSLGLITLCLGGFGLGRNLDGLNLVQKSVTLQSLVLLAPALAMMLGLWVAEHRFARRFHWVPPGIGPMLSTLAASFRSNVGWILAPMMGVMFVIDLSTALPLPKVLPGWSIWLGLGAVAIVAMPIIAQRVFPTMPMDANLKSFIKNIVVAAGVRPVRIAQWDTKHRAHNAMVAGLVGRFRVILVSDRLVAELTRGELAMVILHELAHVRRYHVPLRIMALVPAWILGAVVDHLANRHADSPWMQTWSGTLGAIASLAATVLILKWVSYRSEYDADRFACQLAETIHEANTQPTKSINFENRDSGIDGVPATRELAALNLSSALLKVTAGSEASRNPTWLHPGVRDRIDRLHEFGTGETGQAALTGSLVEPCGC